MLTILGATALMMAGHYTVYTYLGAITAGATAGPFANALTLILVAWGVGVLAGNFHAGFWADKGSGLGAALAALGGGTLLLAISPLTVSHLTTVTVWAAV
ncbi:hypothetical protein [Rhodococcus sp. NPDC076796]|uniref:hypothetical protein n=1 Tax=Rhodococcus sp. NPDC076796 TaxID=3154859 RepID=UPI00344C0A89